MSGKERHGESAGAAKRSPRLYVEEPLRAETIIELNEDQSRYLGQVLRLKPGATVRLFNGQDGEWLARIVDLAKRGGLVQTEAQIRMQTPAGRQITLMVAPIRRARLEWMIEKTTELGVHLVKPVMTAYTNAPSPNTERLRRIAVEAAEQSERLGIPRFEEPVVLQDIVRDLGTDTPLYVAYERGGKPIVDEKFNDTTIQLLCGPEGGFATEELEIFREHQLIRLISLGTNILRAETAAVAAMSVLHAIAGNSRNEPS